MSEPKPEKIRPSYEACMKAYEIILPTIIEIAKKKSAEKKED